MQHIQQLKRRLAAVSAGGLLIAGLGTFLLMGGGPASAASGPFPAGVNPQTAVTATVPTALSLSDNTPSVNFGAGNALPGNTYNATINLAVTSNDAGGDFLTADASGNGNPSLSSSGSATLPLIANLTADGNPGVNNSASCIGGNSCDAFTPLDSSSGAVNNQSFTDTWALTIPASQTPSTYTGAIAYEITGN